MENISEKNCRANPNYVVNVPALVIAVAGAEANLAEELNIPDPPAANPSDGAKGSSQIRLTDILLDKSADAKDYVWTPEGLIPCEPEASPHAQ